jgi:hypothetical protein
MVHLPAVNTPQFDWCKTIYRRRPRPVAPVYQPEVAARAIADAAQGSSPTRIVGSWNRFVIAAASVAPSFAMRYAARTATRAQLSDESTGDDRPTNLQHAADDAHDYGSHGRFDDEAGGVFDPSFLKTLPTTARDLMASIPRGATDGQ